MTDQKIIKDFVEAMNQSKKGTSPYDTTATVVRVEGSTAWVHIPGGVDETPVAMSINAKPGDTVRVRVSGGQAWTIGNDTAPPTDDTRAKAAQVTADEAHVTAIEAAESVKRLDEDLDPEGVFNRLTNNGSVQGILRDETTGDIYINATYINSGAFRITDTQGNTIFLADKTNRVFRWDMEKSTMSANGALTLHDDGDGVAANSSLIIEWHDDNNPQIYKENYTNTGGISIVAADPTAYETLRWLLVTDAGINLTTQINGTDSVVFDIVYSNLSSGMTIQDKSLEDWITDTMASVISDLQTEQLYSVVRYSYAYTCPASGTVNITKNDLGISVPSGYRIAGYIGISTGNADVVPRSWNPQATATGTTIPLRNLTTAQKTGTLAVDVLYLKTSRGTLTT